MAKKRESKFKQRVASNVKKQKTAKSSYGYLNLPKDVSVFKPDPGGRAKLDFLPYEVTDAKHPDRDETIGIAVPGELWYKRPFKIHRNIGVANEAVVCLSSFGERCPICEERTILQRNGASKEETDAIKPSMRNLYVVIPVGKKEDEGLHIWDVSQYLFQNLLNDELEEDEENAAFPDLEEGYTLRIRFDSKSIGKGNAFAEASRIDFDDRDPYEEDILDEVPNLDEVLLKKSYKELKQMFLEYEDEDEAKEEEPEEQDEPEEKKKPARRRRKTVEKEEEPEPEPENDLEDGEILCVACEGTGLNSRGKECRICKGTGSVPEEEPEPEPEKEKPVRRKRTPKKEDDGEKCPHGHKFGKDTDDFPEDCDNCALWNDCIEKKEA